MLIGETPQHFKIGYWANAKRGYPLSLTATHQKEY
ncbi:hypothetical protein AAUPMC_20351, partial [Pasteurella multocida subsp. multocida str. Anand1_cattle]